MRHMADEGGDREHSGKQGRKHKAKQQIKQGKGSRVALREGVELICGMAAAKKVWVTRSISRSTPATLNLSPIFKDKKLMGFTKMGLSFPTLRWLMPL